MSATEPTSTRPPSTVAPGGAVLVAPVPPRPAPPGERSGLAARLRRSPLVRRVTGYSAGSVIAAFTSELAFAGVFGGLHGGTAWASLAGFVGGAVPNYFLNRRWAWKDRRGRRRRDEVALYAAVSIASFAVSVLVTSLAEHWAKGLSANGSLRALLVDAAYLAVSGVFFVGKFVAYELIVFTKGPSARATTGSSAGSSTRGRGGRGGSSGPPGAAATTSGG